MKDKQSKKALQEKYKERKVIGGIYAIRNTLNDKLLLGATTDLQGMRNRFEFSQKTGSCIHVKLQNDWNKQGGEQFVFEVLEELIKGDTQTPEGFATDVNFLKEIWLENLSDRNLY
ncbi:MAG: GIY-YIG nuclease family protein [Oscillospiraceae bacterium]|nr:GIY-YIG nuclease family protein [Oscillospiraceae bacterium]